MIPLEPMITSYQYYVIYNIFSAITKPEKNTLLQTQIDGRLYMDCKSIGEGDCYIFLFHKERYPGTIANYTLGSFFDQLFYYFEKSLFVSSEKIPIAN